MRISIILFNNICQTDRSASDLRSFCHLHTRANEKHFLALGTFERRKKNIQQTYDKRIWKYVNGAQQTTVVHVYMIHMSQISQVYQQK